MAAFLSFICLTSMTTAQPQMGHLDWAKLLVRELRPDDTSYQHKGGYVKWKGQDGAEGYESHTDCSGFLNALFTKAYGFTPAQFERWLGKRRPLAIDYHDAIERQNGFAQISRLGTVKPGDIIAIKYPPDSENSGHILLVADFPTRRRPTRPEVDGTDQWEVSVIDSSRSGHGKTDTRHRDDATFGAGVGQGVFRIYTDRSGQVIGYAWSTFANSEYYDQSTRNLVIGRLDPHFRP
jgi:hypothetical protein